MKPVSGMPRLTLLLGGRELASREMDALASVRVRQALSVPASCELLFSAPSPSLIESVEAGAALNLSVAPGGALFAGEVTAVESAWQGPRVRELRIRGYDLLHRLRKRQPVRAHAQMSAAGLARELAGDLGVPVETSSDSAVWPWLLQWKQTDLDFLAEVAARAGLYLVLADDVLRLTTLEGTGHAIPLVAGEQLLDCELELNADRACRTVDAAGFDLAAVKVSRAHAEGLLSGRPDAEALIGNGATWLADVPAPTPAHLETAARAELLRRAASEVVLRGVADGNPRLRPGARVALSGVATKLRGTYVLTSVEHLIDERRGFVSSVSSAAPSLPAAPDGAAAALGEITQVEATRGRVKLKLASYGDVETDWLPVASAGAGAGKGMIALPDVGDVVVVLFHRSDPARGVVLSGIWSPSGPPDAGVEGGRVRRFALRSAGGQRVELDDDKSALRLSDKTGSFVELTPGGVKIHSKTPLTIEAPGQAIVLQGASIDFRRG
jgi:phage baseplate assembly protein gpV/phage protein D